MAIVTKVVRNVTKVEDTKIGVVKLDLKINIFYNNIKYRE